MINNSNDKKNKTPKLPTNFNVLTFTAACPSCGAMVEFSSPGSVMAVCEYCQTTVIREGDAIKAQGKQSLTIEDYSPLQIGSVGHYKGNDFAIIGRVQLQYDQGVWNEWYLQFADGQVGWLSEALGIYSISLGQGETSELPAYQDLAITDLVTYGGESYQVSDRREAFAIAGEGELPFIMGKGWQTWVIDAQHRRSFITLDYSEAGPETTPIVFAGEAVDLNALDMQLLKNDSQVNDGVSKAGVESNILLDKIECPNCGSPMPYIEGATDYLICPSCHSESKLSGDKAELLKMHSAMQHFDSILPLGAKTRIAAADIVGVNEFALSESEKSKISSSDIYHDYVVIGIMRLNEVGEFAKWTEYLLYSLTDGFLWLSEESNGWFVARVLSEMPLVEKGSLIYDGRLWQQDDSAYRNKVIFAIGAFNWQVNLDDSDLLIDYVNANDVITSEQTEREITYTIAQPINSSTLKQWFGNYLDENDIKDTTEAEGSLNKVIGWHILAQIFAFIVSDGSFIVAIVGALIIFIIYFAGNEIAKSKSGGDKQSSISNYHSVPAFALAVITVILTSCISLFSDSNSSSTSNSEEASSNRGGVVIVPTGSGGRGGFSSGGSHK